MDQQRKRPRSDFQTKPLFKKPNGDIALECLKFIRHFTQNLVLKHGETLEIEGKMGQITQKATQTRMHYPGVLSECVVALNNDLYFKSEITITQHSEINKIMNSLAVSNKDIKYVHSKQTDQFWVAPSGSKTRVSIGKGE